MNKKFFRNDYGITAPKEVLQALSAASSQVFPGYGEDEVCEKARETIKAQLKTKDAQVHFLVGGTQANFTLIASVLRSHQGVIAAETGHISCHETGAVEATGHKVLTLNCPDGKIKPDAVANLVKKHYEDASFEHTVQPGMVYISDSSELGTVYTKKELEALYALCRKSGLYLYIDGARLGYALASKHNDLAFEDLPKLCDAFTIGGTKQGALFGEALVIVNPELQKDFRYHIKQRGGMLAKGFLLGLQFQALFENNLYWDLAAHAIKMADELREAFQKSGFEFLADSPTNQLFPIVSAKEMAVLEENFDFSLIEKLGDDRIALRFCTSWATPASDVEALKASLVSLR